MSNPEDIIETSRGGCADKSVKVLTLGLFGLETQLKAFKPIPPEEDPRDFFLGLEKKDDYYITEKLYWHLWGLAGKK